MFIYANASVILNNGEHLLVGLNRQFQCSGWELVKERHGATSFKVLSLCSVHFLRLAYYFLKFFQCSDIPKIAW